MNKLAISLLFLLCLGSCINLKNPSNSNACPEKNHLFKSNIEYIFPADLESSRIIEFIKECENAVKDNLKIIDESFNDSISIEFEWSKEQMKAISGFPNSAGLTFSDVKQVYILIKENPPIKHELMHIITMLNWGQPHKSSEWMNEGLATYSTGRFFFGLTLKEIYSFLYNHDMLIPIDKLVNKFDKAPPIISYHQSGYLVEYLIVNYGIEKFKKLWLAGFVDFEKIYAISFSEVLKKLESDLTDIKNIIPEVVWKKIIV
jgi:hypothetical protein